MLWVFIICLVFDVEVIISVVEFGLMFLSIGNVVIIVLKILYFDVYVRGFF